MRTLKGTRLQSGIRVPSKKVRERFLLVYELEGCQRAVDYLTKYYGVRRMRIVVNGRRVGNGDLACYEENKAYFSKRGLTKRTVLHELACACAWLVKTDANGNAQWNKTYGGTNDEWSYSVVQNDDGGYALAGTTTSFGVGYANAWLVKTDAAGNAQWNNTYGGTKTDYADSVVQTADGGYALVGTTGSFGAGNARALVGTTTSFGTGGYDFWLVKTDATGDQQWNKTYGGTRYDWASSMVQTADGEYALAGYTYSYGAGSFDFWLVKTDVESGLAWVDSSANTITVYRGATDASWNFVRVRIWQVENP